MKRHAVKIGGKEFRLAYTVEAQELLEEMQPGFSFDQWGELATGTKKFMDALYCLIVAGAHLEHQKLSEDRAWFSAHTYPNKKWFNDIHEEVYSAVADAMSMETDDEDEGAEVDVVLEEIKKNEDPTG